MDNYELLLTKQAEENIEDTLATLITAAQEIAASSEKDFEKIKAKKWYKRLWELVTFNNDNQKIQARGVANLAKLNQITMKAIVLVSKQGKETAAKVCECLSQLQNLQDDVECLFEQQAKITETILTIKRGFETEEHFYELSSNQRDIIFAVFRRYNGNEANEYTQRLLTSMRLLAHDTYDDVNYDIVETELKTNAQKILFSLLHGFSLLLNDILADETHEIFNYICLSENLKSKIRTHVFEEIKTYGKSGYVRLFETQVSESDLFISGEDVEWEECESHCVMAEEICDSNMKVQPPNNGETKYNIIDYQNQEQMNELKLKINRRRERVFVSIEGDHDGVTFRNFPTIIAEDADFTNCTFENTQAIEFSQAEVKNCTFRNVSEISGHYADFRGCAFIRCCSQGPLLTIDSEGSVEGCTFETITVRGQDGYVIYSVYGKKSDVEDITNCRFVDCEAESEDGELTYCCYFKPLSSSKTVDIDNVDYETCVFDNEK